MFKGAYRLTNIKLGNSIILSWCDYRLMVLSEFTLATHTYLLVITVT